MIQALSWNANIPAGATQSFGFVGLGTAEGLEPLSINGDVFGDDGNDVATFAGNRDDYSITQIDDTSVEITGPEGTEVYSDYITFEFADLTQTFEELLVPRLANLTASAILVDDLSLAPGETTTITADIASNGIIDAGISSAELVIATAPDAASIIDSFGTVGLDAVATGDSTSASFELDPGDLAPGTYWAAVRVNGGDALTEENETDNLTQWVEITIEAPVADLILLEAAVGDLTDLNLEGGGRIEMEYVVENASNDSFSYMHIRTYLSTDDVISDDDQSIAGVTGGTFPGSTSSPSTSHYFQEDFAPGDYYLISVVEWGDGTQDATPEDNVIVQTITFIAPPEPVIDVAVTSFEILPGSDLNIGLDGGTLDLSIGLENLGDTTALAGLTVTLSTDDTASPDDITLWTGSAEILEGGFALIDVTAALDETLAAGDYTVLVTADTTGDIDTANNVASAPITLTVPLNPGTQGDDIWISGPETAQVDLLGGNDTAIASLLPDIVDGGDGFDTLDFSQAGVGVDVIFDVVASSPVFLATEFETSGPYSTWSGFEAIVGTEFDDFILIIDAEFNMVIDSGAGNDLIADGAGNDIVSSGSGDDFVFSGLGDDVITLGEGADMVGVRRDAEASSQGPGPEIAGAGHDIVEDFDPLHDTVYIALASEETYDPFADLVQTDEGVVLNYADDSSLLLLGVDISDLTEDNLFAETELISVAPL